MSFRSVTPSVNVFVSVTGHSVFLSLGTWLLSLVTHSPRSSISSLSAFKATLAPGYVFTSQITRKRLLRRRRWMLPQSPELPPELTSFRVIKGRKSIPNSHCYRSTHFFVHNSWFFRSWLDGTVLQSIPCQRMSNLLYQWYYQSTNC